MENLSLFLFFKEKMKLILERMLIWPCFGLLNTWLVSIISN